MFYFIVGTLQCYFVLLNLTEPAILTLTLNMPLMQLTEDET